MEEGELFCFLNTDFNEHPVQNGRHSNCLYESIHLQFLRKKTPFVRPDHILYLLHNCTYKFFIYFNILFQLHLLLKLNRVSRNLLVPQNLLQVLPL